MNDSIILIKCIKGLSTVILEDANVATQFGIFGAEYYDS